MTFIPKMGQVASSKALPVIEEGMAAEVSKLKNAILIEMREMGIIATLENPLETIHGYLSKVLEQLRQKTGVTLHEQTMGTHPIKLPVGGSISYRADGSFYHITPDGRWVNVQPGKLFLPHMISLERSAIENLPTRQSEILARVRNKHNPSSEQTLEAAYQQAFRETGEQYLLPPAKIAQNSELGMVINQLKTEIESTISTKNAERRPLEEVSYP